MPAKRKASTRTTTKQVQAADAKPYIPHVDVKPEVDEDSWGDDGLTYKQRLFARFYVCEAAGNATKAARLAGYRDDNIESLRVTAFRTLTKANVQRAIARHTSERFGSPEDVKAGIAEIANGNAAVFLKMGDDGEMHVDLAMMAESGSLGLLREVNEETISINEKVSTTKIKIKVYDRLRALELLAKLNGQLRDNVDLTSGGKAIKLFAGVDVERV